jgi:predicted nucleic-acid-binding Zn-ribbon protein
LTIKKGKDEGIKMAISNKAVVKCSKCGESIDFEVFRSVNAHTDPELAAKAKSRELFKCKCPKCGNESYVNYDFLYNDPDKRIMIYMIFEENKLKDICKLLSSKEIPGYTMRVVGSQQSLVEKIMMFESGLDDRSVEIGKSVMYYNNYKLFKEAGVSQIRFNHREDGSNEFLMIAGSKLFARVGFPKKEYDKISSLYGDRYLALAKDDIAIDLAWGKEMYDSVVKYGRE